jgi:hypothetical protein
MIRRRRPNREIPFSFDSFLDVVTNVVGIILRLILITWVGARSYKSIMPPSPPPAPALTEPAPLPEPEDPLSPELEEQRRTLAEARALLVKQAQEWEKAHHLETLSAEELARLTAQSRQLAEERTALERSAGEKGQAARLAALSLEELRTRGKRLAEEVAELAKSPPPRQALRYRTPVSRPLQSEEMFFECRRGRVTLIDIGGLLDDVHRHDEEIRDTLRREWEYHGVTTSIGAFRLRYTFERRRAGFDGAVPGSRPDPNSGFQAEMSSEVEPVADPRGETADTALSPSSEFRRVIDSLEPMQTAVTFWVYPDSFALYRRLRDFLAERDFVVAGRPLPEGHPIGSSRHGTNSRGQ